MKVAKDVKRVCVGSLVGLLVVIGWGGLATPVLAEGGNLVSNGSFESPGFSNSDDVLMVAPYAWWPVGSPTMIAGWQFTYDNQYEPSYWGKAPSRTAYDGSYTVYFDDGDTLETTFPVEAGESYTLSFNFAIAHVNTTGLRVDVAGSNRVFLPEEGVLTGVICHTPYDNPPWREFTYTFTAGASDPSAVLKFTNVSDNALYDTMIMDNVRVTPEPASLLLVMGSFLLVARNRRRL